MELVIVIAVVAILAAAFSSVMVPMMNSFFYYPQSSRVNSAGSGLLNIIVEGDNLAKGLRFTGLPCAVGGAGGGGSTITAASTAGSTSTLTYNYTDSDYCGDGARTSHTVTLVYDSSIGTVTRAIDGGTANNIPYYVDSSSDINFSVSGGGTDLFHYIASDGTTDLGAAPAVANIYRVDIDVIASSGSGVVKHNAGQIRLKTGVEIKRYTT